MDTGAEKESLLSHDEKTQVFYGLRWVCLSIGFLCVMLGSGGAGEPTESAVTIGYLLLTAGALVWLYEFLRNKQHQLNTEPTLRNRVVQLTAEYPSAKTLAAKYIAFFNGISVEIEEVDEASATADLTFELQAFYAGFLLSKMQEEGVDIDADEDLGAKLMMMFQFIYLPMLTAERTEHLMEINRQNQGSDAFREGFTAGTYIDSTELLADYYHERLGIVWQ